MEHDIHKIVDLEPIDKDKVSKKLKTFDGCKVLLTEKQHAFARYLMAHPNEPDTNAYKFAYKTDGMKPNTLATETSKAKAHPNVQAFIHEMNVRADRAMLTKMMTTKEYVIDGLRRESNPENNNTTPSSRVRSLELLGKTIKLFNDESSEEKKFRNAVEIEDRIKKILKIASETTRSLKNK